MDLSHVVACGLFLALLALGLEAKPAPRHLPKGPSAGSAAALGRQLAELLEAPSGAARGGGGGGTKAASGAQQQQQQQQQPQPRGKGSPASQRLLRDLRTDAKQARPAWARLLHPEHQAAGGGGGGGGSRRLKGLSKKGLSKGCFGLKLDRIGSRSGLGC